MLARQPFSEPGGYSLVDWENGQRDIVPNREADRIERLEEKRGLASPEEWAAVLKTIEEKERAAQPMLAQGFAPPTGMRSDAATPVLQASPALFRPGFGIDPKEMTSQVDTENRERAVAAYDAKQAAKEEGPPPPPQSSGPSPAEARAMAQAAGAELGDLGIPKSVELDNATRKVYVPGTPGRPGYSEKDAAKRFAIQDTRAERVEGKDLTPEEKQGILDYEAETGLDRRLTQERQNEIDMADAQAKLAQSQAMAALTKQRYEQRALAQAQDEREYQELERATKAEVLASGNEEVDQSRWMESRNGFQKVAAIASIALASGAAGKSDMGIIGRFIERDIESQQARINTRRGRADNALNRLSERFGSLTAGRKALEAVQYDMFAQKILEEGDRYGTERAKLAAAKASEEVAVKARDSWAAVRDSMIGQRTRENRDKFMDPIAAIAATRGYERDPTLEEVGGRNVNSQTQYGTAADIFKKRADTQKAIADAKAAETGGGVNPDKRAALLAELGDKDAENQAVLTSMDQVMRDTGLTFKDGKPVIPPGGMPGFGEGMGGKFLAITPNSTPEARETHRTITRFVEALIRKESGAAIGQDETEKRARNVLGSETAESFARRFGYTAEEVWNAQAARRAGRGAVIDEYDASVAREKARIYGNNPGGSGSLSTNPLVK